MGISDRYVNSISLSFGKPTLTYETQTTPYVFWHIAELYLENGGSRATLDRILADNGLNAEQLRQLYEAYFNATSGRGNAPGNDAEGDLGPGDVAVAIAQYCEVYNHVKSLPADSAQFISEDERMIVEGLPDVIDYYLANGGTVEELRKYPEYVKYEQSLSGR